MASFYTAQIVESNNLSLSDYIWRVASGMFRDKKDVPTVEDYPEDEDRELDLEGLAEAKAALAKLAATSDEELVAEERRRLVDGLVKYEQESQKRILLRERYETLRAKIIDWKVPTPNHQNLKDFARSEIENALSHDCSWLNRDNYVWSERSAAEIRAEGEKDARWDIQRYESNIKVSREHRANMRNWIATLEASLPRPKD